MGLALLGAFAAASAVQAGWWARAIAAALLSLYLFVQTPHAAWACKWWYLRSQKVERVVLGALAARQTAPEKTLVLTGVDEAIFDGAFWDGAFRAFGVEGVYADPGERAQLAAATVMQGQDLSSYFLDPADFQRGLLQHRVNVLSIAGPIPVDVTARFEAEAQAAPRLLPHRVDAGSALSTDYLRGEWYGLESDHRWMGKTAGVMLAGPQTAGEQLRLAGYCASGQTALGPLTGKILVDGVEVGKLRVIAGDAPFDAAFPLPAGLSGKPSIEVTVQLGRTFRAPGDTRDLGLVFGSFEVR